MNPQVLLSELDDMQLSLDRWYERQSADMTSTHAKFRLQLEALEATVSGNGGAAAAALVTAAKTKMTAQKPQGLEWDSLVSADGTPARQQSDVRTPSLASPPVSHPINYESLIDDVTGGQYRNSQNGAPKSRTYGGNQSHNTSVMSDTDSRTRPTPESMMGDLSSNTVAPASRTMPCQVLVEFKRKRILQFESPYYVAPGEYVVVGGDRGEDIGLVTHSWPQGQKGEIPGVGRWSGGVGMGKVVRVANVLEVSQLQGVQTELESRAVDVAQEKVREHQLPMKIVDAEYQFDRKKLTFYYQSQHRLDFRNLVRDLYKTFRARIWMEQDTA